MPSQASPPVCPPSPLPPAHSTASPSAGPAAAAAAAGASVRAGPDAAGSASSSATRGVPNALFTRDGAGPAQPHESERISAQPREPGVQRTAAQLLGIGAKLRKSGVSVLNHLKLGAQSWACSSACRDSSRICRGNRSSSSSSSSRTCCACRDSRTSTTGQGVAQTCRAHVPTTLTGRSCTQRGAACRHCRARRH